MSAKFNTGLRGAGLSLIRTDRHAGINGAVGSGTLSPSHEIAGLLTGGGR